MKYYQENQDEVLHRYAQHQCPTQGHLLQQRQEASHQKIRSQSFFDPALLVNNVNKLQHDLKPSSDYISSQLSIEIIRLGFIYRTTFRGQKTMQLY